MFSILQATFPKKDSAVAAIFFEGILRGFLPNKPDNDPLKDSERVVHSGVISRVIGCVHKFSLNMKN